MIGQVALSGRKKTVFCILAVFLGCVLGLIVLELCFRVVHGDKYKDITLNYFPEDSVIYDEAVGWKYRPGYRAEWKYFEYAFNVNINSLGLRDREYNEKKKKRILFIGDSFTFGVGVELVDTFVKRVESILLGQGFPIECINGGRVGAGTGEYLYYARKYVKTLKPDCIVLCLYPENDVNDTWELQHEGKDKFQDMDGEVYVDGKKMARNRTHQAGPLFNHSAFYRYLRLALASFSVNYNEKSITEKKWLDVFLNNNPEWVKDGWRETFENINEINDLCLQNKVELCIVLIPSDFILDDDMWDAMMSEAPTPMSDYDRDNPFMSFTRHADWKNIPLMDLTPRMKERNGRMYFKHDRHFNRKGHDVAGRAIAEFVEFDSPDVLKSP